MVEDVAGEEKQNRAVVRKVKGQGADVCVWVTNVAAGP